VSGSSRPANMSGPWIPMSTVAEAMPGTLWGLRPGIMNHTLARCDEDGQIHGGGSEGRQARSWQEAH
jgi:hypothetical protein